MDKIEWHIPTNTIVHSVSRKSLTFRILIPTLLVFTRRMHIGLSSHLINKYTYILIARVKIWTMHSAVSLNTP